MTPAVQLIMEEINDKLIELTSALESGSASGALHRLANLSAELQALRIELIHQAQHGR